MNKMGNSKTVYRTILRPLLIVVLVEIVLMTGSYWILGINDQLDKNARDNKQKIEEAIYKMK